MAEAMDAVLDPPITMEALREGAERFERDLGGALLVSGPPTATGELSFSRYQSLRHEILRLVRSPAWGEHDLARELLLALEDLQDVVATEDDAGWKAREILMRMRVVMRAMLRQIGHEVLDEPHAAAEYAMAVLAGAEISEIARLLGVSTRTLGNWQAGRVGAIRKNPQRIILIAQLIYDLRPSLTGRGVLLWFDAPREQFDGRTPLALIDSDPADAAEKLRPLARGGRAQLGT